MDFFYGGGSHAVKAAKAELKANADRLRNIVRNHGLTLVGVNKYYKTSCACIKPGERTIYSFDVYEGRLEEVRRGGQLGYAYADPWEGAPNLVKVEDIESGQMEMELSN